MKRFCLIALCLLPALLMAQGDFNLSGHVKGLKTNDKIYLFYQIDGKTWTDSATVQDGNFHFTGKVSQPSQATISLNKNLLVSRPIKGEKVDIFRFYVEPGKLNFNASDSLKHIVISGSKINDENNEWKALRKPAEVKQEILEKEIAMLTDEQKNNQQLIANMIVREKQYMQELNAVGLEFAKTHPNSYLSLLTLKEAAADAETTEAAAQAFQNLSAQLKDTEIGQRIVLLLASSAKTRIGSPAIDFAQTTPEGKTIRLSDFKGRYVLLDFWASWCGPCRQENPNVVAAYHKYKDKGFDILGVSLDKPGQKEAWVNAIAEDKLIWAQVSDLKGGDNAVALQYGIRSIPANFLIDPSGKIIAKDLRSKTLNAKLAELLGKPVK